MPMATGESRQATKKVTPEMFIQTELTPNPETIKFLPGDSVLAEGSADFADQEAASISPLAGAIFEVEEVSRVFLGTNFISVSKSGGEWAEVKPQILGAIMQHYTSGAPVMNEGATLPVSRHNATASMFNRPTRSVVISSSK